MQEGARRRKGIKFMNLLSLRWLWPILPHSSGCVRSIVGNRGRRWDELLGIDVALADKCLPRRKAERKKSPETLHKLRRAPLFTFAILSPTLQLVHVIDTFQRLDWATSCIVMLACKRIREFLFRQGNKISLTTAGRSTTSVRYHNECRLLLPCEYSCLAIGSVLHFSLCTCYSYLLRFFARQRRFFSA